MKLEELINGLDNVKVHGDPSVDIISVEYNSKKVRPESMFVAIRGFSFDGNVFIPEAVHNGAAAVVTDNLFTTPDLTVVCVPDVRKALAHIADRFYGSPQKELVMTGVTGTNGKTTTTYMVKSIFDTGGMNCGLIGTIKHIVAGEVIESINTTPEATDIHSYLNRMVEAHQSSCVLEVSSHALALSRIQGIQFRAAAFLNITRDHLDFHGDIKKYLEAKSFLFSELPGDSVAVVNRDDPYSDHIINVSRGTNVITFGSNEQCDIYPLSMKLEPHRSMVILATPSGEIAFTLSIPGRFNVFNAMAAVGIGLACGFTLDIIAAGLEFLKGVEGRYEIIDEGQEFTVIVDYAHSPDALENILSSGREISKGRLISVFGCGGDRDKGKRSLMGEISTRIADYSVITSDNPRTEDPIAIIADIMEGIPTRERCEVIAGRKEAIEKAISTAGPGDTVVIAGKGHENYQIIGTEKNHFDDAETARRFLRTLG